jgi:hypothetical protein
MTSRRALPFFVPLVLSANALAGGCHIYVDEPAHRTAYRPPAPPPQPPAPPPSQAPAASATPAPSATQTHAVAPRPILHLGGVAPGPNNSPPATATPTPTATATATASASPAVPACLDANAATVPDCTTVKAPDTTCAPFPLPQQRCSAYKTYFDPKIAAQAISCMASLSSKQICDATQTAACSKSALARACPDPALGQLCSIATTPCKAVQTDCMTLLSGLNDQGQEKVAACVAQGCSGGLQGCVDALK